jgi:signal transduction histidine kinase
MFSLSYTTKPRGTGVGLSVSRAIVEAHGGRLWAEQNPGAGATFSFTIPIHSSGAAASPSHVAAARTTRAGLGGSIPH